jgi:hypothetical protein
MRNVQVISIYYESASPRTHKFTRDLMKDFSGQGRTPAMSSPRMFVGQSYPVLALWCHQSGWMKAEEQQQRIISRPV